MFDSPMDHCPVCGQMVVLDQPQTECAGKHKCSAETPCPLQKYFAAAESGPDLSTAKPSLP
jgi:hypothetical protein